LHLCHAEAGIGAVKLTQLSPAVLGAFTRRLKAAGRLDAMVRKVRMSLGAILDAAKLLGLVSGNVVKDNRRKSGTSWREEKKIVPPDRREVQKLFEVAGTLKSRKNTLKYLRPLVMIAAPAGLRASELRGLRWRQVDFEARAEACLTGKPANPTNDFDATRRQCDAANRLIHLYKIRD